MSGSSGPHRPRAAQYDGQKFETRAIHAGQEPDPTTGAVIPPVYMTSTYQQSAPGEYAGYDYSRTDNPTRRNLEVQVAALDDADHGVAFSSGMAAISTLLQTLDPGDHVVCVDDVYGGTYRLFTKVLERHAGINFSFTALETPEQLTAAMTARTKLVWIETPTNPLLNVVDIRAMATVAHAAGAKLVVDNTFATPYLQRPLAFGADVVAYSTTKYFGGHSDVVGGALVLNDDELAGELRFLQNAVGAVPGPMDCWLVTRGLKTLHVRMDRHCSNAAAVAALLEGRDDVLDVRYPGLASHPQYDVASAQMSQAGGMVSFRPAGGVERARELVGLTNIFCLAESLGGVESLIELPGAMTHQTLEGSSLEVPADLIRLSVGIEHVEDLLSDLTAALDATKALAQAALT
jgi:cystathionine gamma-synthase